MASVENNITRPVVDPQVPPVGMAGSCVDPADGLCGGLPGLCGVCGFRSNCLSVVWGIISGKVLLQTVLSKSLPSSQFNDR